MKKRAMGILALLICGLLGWGPACLAEATDAVDVVPAEPWSVELDAVWLTEAGAVGIDAPEAADGLEAVWDEAADAGDESAGDAEAALPEVWIGELDEAEGPAEVMPAEGATDGIAWTLSDDGTLTLSGRGNVEWLSGFNPQAVRRVVVGEGITGLGNVLCYNWGALESVQLPQSLTAIGDWTFSGTKLSGVRIPGGVKRVGDYAFSGVAMTSLELCEGLESIGEWAFSGVKLAELRIPASVQSIGELAFYSATLTKLEFGGGVAVLANSAFSNATIAELKIPGNFGDIPSAAFGGMRLARLELGEGVERIGDSAFSSAQLTELKIPGSVKSIGAGAFSGAPLTRLELGQGVGSIGEKAFQSAKLTELKIPGSVKSVGNSAFYNAPLTSLELGQGVGSLGNSAFFYARLTELTIPGSVTSVGDYAFRTSALTRLELGEGVGRIGERAFYSASPAELKIPGSVTSVGDYAFYNAAPQRLELGEGVESLGKYAFGGVERVALPASLKVLGERALGTRSEQTVVVRGTPALGDSAFGAEALEIRFEGGVPAFSKNTFGAQQAVVAFYPGQNPAWTAAVRRDYGSRVVWVDATKRDAEADADRRESDALKPEETVRKEYFSDNGDDTYNRIVYTGKAVYVEIYRADDDALIWKHKLKMELPIWGGYYAGTDYHFILFGQKNEAESDSVEVVRIVRYTKNWNRVDAASIRGNNTVEPFAFGNVSATQSGDILNVHTAHVMYKSSDGVNHQANLFIDVYIPTMTATAVKGEVSYFGTGYVSHSLDQYIIRDGNDIVQLDLGDAYPRAVVMTRVPNGANSPIKSRRSGTMLEILPIVGRLGDNHTGVTLAGLEATESAYLTAGISQTQKGNDPANPKNVFVATVDRDCFDESGIRLRWITHYAAKQGLDLTAPRLVKLSDDALALFWTQNREKTLFVYLDGEGNPTSQIWMLKDWQVEGSPLMVGGTLCWVYPDHSVEAVADITVDPSAPKPVPVPEMRVVKDNEKGERQVNVGDQLKLVPVFDGKSNSGTVSWKSSNKKIVAVSKQGVTTAKKVGKARITATGSDGQKRSIVIRVLDDRNLKKVKLNKTGTVKLKKGKKLKLKATLVPSSCVTVLTWKTSNAKVATVNKDGTVKALKKGTAVITVKTANGKTAKVKIKVI